MAVEVGAQTDPDFRFEGIPPVEGAPEGQGVQPTAQAANPLGNLAELPGKWVGHGFNAIWRPHHPSSQDRFLELNLTKETLAFTKINGPIPNRGLAMHDINLFGLTYMQQIAEASNGNGLHIEPGIWAHTPATSNPQEPATVVRMASIPHGTVILAQGQGNVVNGGPQIADNNILPFGIGGTPPPNSAFNQVAQTFSELNLSQTTRSGSSRQGSRRTWSKTPTA